MQSFALSIARTLSNVPFTDTCLLSISPSLFLAPRSATVYHPPDISWSCCFSCWASSFPSAWERTWNWGHGSPARGLHWECHQRCPSHGSEPKWWTKSWMWSVPTRQRYAKVGLRIFGFLFAFIICFQCSRRSTQSRNLGYSSISCVQHCVQKPKK